MSKAASLQRLHSAGFDVPPFFVVRDGASLDDATLEARLRALGAAPGTTFAVRSSADVEDGVAASYAGLFRTELFVAPGDVAASIERVRAASSGAALAAYRAQLGATGAVRCDVIVQVMVDARAAGVAFGRDPVDGSERIVVTAAYGTGSAVVDGSTEADTYRVTGDGTIVERRLGAKTVAATRCGTVAVAEDAQTTAALDDATVTRIAQLTAAIGRAFGAPQDVEWALAGEFLFVLQARPVTTPPGIVWDNSNIAESYGGLVSPLTFTFARHAYAGAYRQFMRVLAIGDDVIAAHHDDLESMIGLVQGRMYYRLLTWYRLLATVPGFRLNRRFMEAMMGVSEPLDAATVAGIARRQRLADAGRVLRTLGALVWTAWRLPVSIARFRRLIDRELHAAMVPADASFATLNRAFDRLEAALLHAWKAPLANDFLAMIWYGILRRLAMRWCDDADGTLQNGLLGGRGGMISTEPAERVATLAVLAAAHPEVVAVLATGTAAAARAAIAERPALRDAFDAYVARFGDRMPNELKLESPTLADDPLPLMRAVARLATAAPVQPRPNRGCDAQAVVRARLRGQPLRALVFHVVAAQARARVRDRENLRFERTRVFGAVRRIVVAMGCRLHEAGRLDDPRDVFWLELDELRSGAFAPDTVAQRRRRYAEFAALPAPPERFTALDDRPPTTFAHADAGDPHERCGIGASPGIVRGRVRIVRDPQSPFQPGEILVAERTDPGWVVLFPAAAGILVERGSVLSHAAIVSRELGIPSVVAVPGLVAWLNDGDEVEFDGRSGRVTRLGPGTP